MNLVLSLQKLPFGDGDPRVLESSASATCSATSINGCPVTSDQQICPATAGQQLF